MVVLGRQLVLLCLLVLLPAAAQARLTLGWVPGAAILGSEEQVRRLAAHLESRLAEPVVLRSCADETQLHDWLQRYRMVDFAPLSQDYLRGVPPGQLLLVADLHSGSATATLVLRQGLRSDQQRQLRTLLANLAEEPTGRDLLTGLGDLRLTPPAGASRGRPAAGSAGPPPRRSNPAEFVWPDQQRLPQPALPEATPVAAPSPPPPVLPEGLLVTAEPAASPPVVPVLPKPESVAEKPAPPSPSPVTLVEPISPAAPVMPAPEAEPPPEPVSAPLPAPPAVALPAAVVPTGSAAIPPLPTPEPEVAQRELPGIAPLPAPKPEPEPVIAATPTRLATLPPKVADVPPPPVAPKLSEQTVSRSLSSGRQPLADGASRQTIYLVLFTTIMVPLPVAEAVFDQFVETLNQSGGLAGYEFVILKDELERIDPTWLRKATYVTGEIFGYVEESGCCSTDIRSKSRLALYRPGSSEPRMRHEYPAKAFFDHDYSTLDAERKKLAERISQDLSSQLLKALGGG